MKLKLTPKRLYHLLTAAMIVLVLLALMGTWFGHSLLTTQSNKLLDLKLERDVLEEQQTALDKAKADLDRYAELKQIAQQTVPQEKDQVRTVREIIKFADEAGVNIGSITFPGSDLGQQTAKTGLTQLEPVEGLASVYQLEVTLTNATPTRFADLISLLKKLESNRRTSQVITISITPDAANRNLLTFNIVLNVYIKPDGGKPANETGS